MPDFDLDSALAEDGRPKCKRCCGGQLCCVDSWVDEGVGTLVALCKTCDCTDRQSFRFALVGLTTNGQAMTLGNHYQAYCEARYCPFCESNDLDVATFDPILDEVGCTERQVKYGVYCNGCERHWWEIYEYA